TVRTSSAATPDATPAPISASSQWNELDVRESGAATRNTRDWATTPPGPRRPGRSSGRTLARTGLAMAAATAATTATTTKCRAKALARPIIEGSFQPIEGTVSTLRRRRPRHIGATAGLASSTAPEREPVLARIAKRDKTSKDVGMRGLRIAASLVALATAALVAVFPLWGANLGAGDVSIHRGRSLVDGDGRTADRASATTELDRVDPARERAGHGRALSGALPRPGVGNPLR